MPDYSLLKVLCEKERDETAALIDGFLLPYAERKDKLEKDFLKKIDKFKKLKPPIDDQIRNYLAYEYMCHRIFRQDGLIHKYLKNADLKELKKSDLQYLKLYADNPWRFSFSVIIDSPADDFYLMHDIFTEEEYLVYSKAITTRLTETEVLMWFNLLRYNGQCYQTCGAVMGFHGIDLGDICYYAEEIEPGISEGEELTEIMEIIEKDPVPFLVLITATHYPIVEIEGEEVKCVSSEFEIEDISDIDITDLEERFIIKRKDSVFRLTDRHSQRSADGASAYIDAEKETLFLYAISEERYEALVEALNDNGFDLPEDPSIFIHIQFVVWLEMALGKRIVPNPYETMFEGIQNPLTQEEMVLIEKKNRILELATPQVNEGIELDVAQLAAIVGLDYNYTREFLIQTFQSIPQFRLSSGIDPSLN